MRPAFKVHLWSSAVTVIYVVIIRIEKYVNRLCLVPSVVEAVCDESCIWCSSVVTCASFYVSLVLRIIMSPVTLLNTLPSALITYTWCYW